jgi:PAP2 superfamily
MALNAGTSHQVPRRALVALRLEGRRMRTAIDLLLAAWLIWLFDAVNNLAPVRQGLAVSDGRSVLSFERSIHLAPEHALNAWLARHDSLSQIVVFWYENVHIVVTLVALGVLCWRREDRDGTLRLTLLSVNLIALVVFWSFPVAPPRMLSSSYVDLVSYVQHLPVWRQGATALHSNQLCSMPSLHIAWATWSSIVLWRMTKRRSLRVLGVIYPLITTFAVMATANHYLLDALTGAAITLAVFFALSLMRARSTTVALGAA